MGRARRTSHIDGELDNQNSPSTFYTISAAIGGSANLHWLVTINRAPPRMIFDQTGSLANVKRHDYLPFGEELFAPVGGRFAAQGYSGGDGVRQQFYPQGTGHGQEPGVAT